MVVISLADAKREVSDGMKRSEKRVERVVVSMGNDNQAYMRPSLSSKKKVIGADMSVS